MTKQTAAIVHVPALVAPVKKIVTAFNSLEKAQSKLGDAVLSVAPSIEQSQIDPFCAMLKTQLEASNPGRAGSIKTQVSYIRRVVTAIVVDGVEVEPGQSLRGLYDSLPKKETGGAAHAKKGAKLPNPGAGETVATVTLSPAEARALDINAAITKLFGYCEPDLVAAVEYAAANTGVFMRWAGASAKAAQMAELEAAITAPTKAPAKSSRKAKAEAATV